MGLGRQSPNGSSSSVSGWWLVLLYDRKETEGFLTSNSKGLVVSSQSIPVSLASLRALAPPPPAATSTPVASLQPSSSPAWGFPNVIQLLMLGGDGIGKWSSGGDHK